MLKNIKISKKLIATFILVALISSISGILGSYLLSKSDKDYSAALEEFGFTQGEIGKLGMEINLNRAYIRDIVFLEDKAALDKAYNDIQTNSAAIDTLITQIATNDASDESKKLFENIQKELAEFRVVQNKVIDLGMSGKEKESYTLWTNEGRPKADKLGADIETLLQLNTDEGTKVSTNLTTLGNTMILVMAVSIILGFIIAICIAIFVAKGISKPVVEVQKAAIEMAKGNYDVNITYESRDEIGSLAQNMRIMMKTTKDIILDTAQCLGELAQNNFDIKANVEYIGVFKDIETAMLKISSDLSLTIFQIKTASNQVSSGSNQVSSTAQSLAQGATEQASSVQELSAAINEVSQQIKNNASNSESANNLANVVRSYVDTSNNQMSEMMVAMSEISDSSSEISKIIKAIEDIAFQTNILALNAAVEAARAGAAGKGFAVVADEVRNLAGKSAEAANQTNDLIEHSVKSVEKGSAIANETSLSLANVVTGTADITDLIGKISVASSEQATVISQIESGVDQISAVVQTNSATSEESAAASEELSGQADLMNSLVSKFNLKKGVEDVSDFSTPKIPRVILPHDHFDAPHFTSDKY